MCSWKAAGKANKEDKAERVGARVLRVVLASTLGGSFQFGFSTGFVNNTEVFVKHHFVATGLIGARGFDTMWSLAVSSFALGGLIGTCLFPALANRAGRKLAVLITTGFVYTSSYMIAFPAGWWALIVGRVLIGIGAGGACAVVPMYVAEIAPLSARGMLGTVHQLMITVGILVAQGLSAQKLHLLGDDELWRYILLVPCACATVLLLVLPGCEDSPLHLLRVDGHRRAAAALRWFRGADADEDAICEEVARMQVELSLSGSDKGVGLMEVVRHWRLLGPVLVGCGVNLSMQLSGIDAVLYYSTRVLEDAGVDFAWAQVCSAGIAALNTLVTVPAMLLMDTAGRKVIQGIGLGGMCAAYVVMTGALVLHLHLLAVVAMCFVVCFFAFGPGCIAWFIVAELTPVSARGLATALGLGANWLANFLVAFAFPHLLARFHAWTFGIFAVSTFVLTGFTVFCLPETKGKTVAQIAEHFAPAKPTPAAAMPTLLPRGPGSPRTLVGSPRKGHKSPVLRKDSALSDLSTVCTEGDVEGGCLSLSALPSLAELAEPSWPSPDMRTPLLGA